MSALSDLQAAVAGLSTSVDSAVHAIQSGANDSAQLVALTAELTAAKSKLDAAVGSVTTQATPAQ